VLTAGGLPGRQYGEVRREVLEETSLSTAEGSAGAEEADPGTAGTKAEFAWPAGRLACLRFT
jgi:hypothetical protein